MSLGHNRPSCRHFLGDVALTADRVDAHDRALNDQQIEQLGDRDDFVGLSATLICLEQEALARRVG
jgi:hypothetical protein